MKHICENTTEQTFEVFPAMSVCRSWWRCSQSRIKLYGEKEPAGVLRSGIAVRPEEKAQSTFPNRFSDSWERGAKGKLCCFLDSQVLLKEDVRLNPSYSNRTTFLTEVNQWLQVAECSCPKWSRASQEEFGFVPAESDR